MQLILVFLVVALVFGVCFCIDKLFQKLFRSRVQHRSGTAVRYGNRYPLFGVLLSMLGVFAIATGVSEGALFVIGGIVALLAGLFVAIYYISFGVFYDEETFLYSRFGKKSLVYAYRDIQSQALYLVQGGATMIELHMADGSAVSLMSNMEGAIPFLNAAFDAWCRQTGRDPESCDFHDPSQHQWFPFAEEK